MRAFIAPFTVNRSLTLENTGIIYGKLEPSNVKPFFLNCSVGFKIESAS